MLILKKTKPETRETFLSQQEKHILTDIWDCLFADKFGIGKGYMLASLFLAVVALIVILKAMR